jgi:hypothetical protein
MLANGRELAGMKVRHDAEELNEGETMILTLADRNILDAQGGIVEDAEELENVLVVTPPFSPLSPKQLIIRGPHPEFILLPSQILHPETLRIWFCGGEKRLGYRTDPDLYSEPLETEKNVSTFQPLRLIRGHKVSRSSMQKQSENLISFFLFL